MERAGCWLCHRPEWYSRHHRRENTIKGEYDVWSVNSNLLSMNSMIDSWITDTGAGPTIHVDPRVTCKTRRTGYFTRESDKIPHRSAQPSTTRSKGSFPPLPTATATTSATSSPVVLFCQTSTFNCPLGVPRFLPVSSPTIILTLKIVSPLQSLYLP